MRELVAEYLSHSISRRRFVGGLTKAGLTATAAQSVLTAVTSVSYAQGAGPQPNPPPAAAAPAAPPAGGGAPAAPPGGEPPRHAGRRRRQAVSGFRRRRLRRSAHRLRRQICVR